AGIFPSDRLFELGSLGEISLFAGSLSDLPDGWMPAAGQIIDIASNAALFSLLGTSYGGNGQTNFALPDLRGRVAIGSDRPFSSAAPFGSDSIVLDINNLPSHSHVVPIPASLPMLAGALATLFGRRLLSWRCAKARFA
ncbi:MAG: tail fiber protein, partial [Pseudomonadota bacterium]